MSDTKIVRIEVDNEIWRKIKAKASLKDKHVKDYANEIFKKEVEDLGTEI